MRFWVFFTHSWGGLDVYTKQLIKKKANIYQKTQKILLDLRRRKKKFDQENNKKPHQVKFFPQHVVTGENKTEWISLTASKSFEKSYGLPYNAIGISSSLTASLLYSRFLVNEISQSLGRNSNHEAKTRLKVNSVLDHEPIHFAIFSSQFNYFQFYQTISTINQKLCKVPKYFYEIGKYETIPLKNILVILKHIFQALLCF